MGDEVGKSFFYKDGPKAVFEKARHFIAEGDYQKSREILDSFLSENNDSAVGNLYAGVSCLYMDELEEAKKYFSECRRLSPGNYLAEDYCLLCDFLSGDDSVALKFDLKNLHASTEFTAFLYRALASRIIEIGLESGEIKPAEEKKESENAYDEGSDIKDNFEDALPESGHHGDRDAVSSDVPNIELEKPEGPEKNTDESSGASKDLKSEGEDAVAETDSNHVDKTPENDSGLSESEESAGKRKEPDRNTLAGAAEAFFDEFASYMYFTAGKFFSDRENFGQAEKMFRIALERSSNIRRIHFCFGETLFMLKKFDEACVQLELSLNEDGDAPETLYYLGVCCKHRGEYSRAKELFGSALKQFEKFPEIHCALGEIALIEGDRNGALAAFSKASDGDAMILEEIIKQAKEKISGLNKQQ